MSDIRIKTKFAVTNSFVFFVIWSVYIFSYFVFSSSELHYNYHIISTLFDLEQYAIMGILLIDVIFLNKYNLHVIFKYLAFGTFALLMQLTSPDKVLLVLTLFVLSARNIEFRKILELDMKLKLISLVIVVSLCLVGVIDNYAADINGTFKQAFGFSHPNTLGGLCYIAMSEYIVLKWRSIRPVHFIAIGIAGIIAIAVSGSRTMGYTFFLIYFLFLLYKGFPKLFSLRIVQLMFSFIMPAMFALSFALVRMYDNHNKLAIKLNDILTTRIALASNFLKLYDVKPWGQEIELVSTRVAAQLHKQPMILDNAYVRGVLMYGMLFMIFLSIAYIFLMRYFLKNQKAEYAIFSLYFILIGIGESYMLNIAFNITLLLLIEHTIEKLNIFDIIADIRNGRFIAWKKQA